MKLSISTTRQETLWGLGYILFSQFVLPLALALINASLPQPLTATEFNLLYFAVNFLSVLLILHRFLWESVKAFVKMPWRCLRYAALGIVVYYAASVAVNYLVYAIDWNFSNVNNEYIADMTQEHSDLMVLFTVFFVPITEELLYRGVVFQGLHRKSRLLAYLVSVCVFAGIHVLSYVGLYDIKTLMLCFLQYLPAGIVVAWVYEHTDNIVAPILMHIAINQIAMSAMR